MSEFLSEPQRWALPAVLVVALVGTPVALWWERQRPSSYTRRPEVLEEWRSLSVAAQQAYDNAVLDANEAAEDAVRRAVDTQMQRAVEDAARRNVPYHP